MSQTISAVYEKGILVLKEPLAISEGTKVKIVVVISESKKKKKTVAEVLADIAALPLEGKGEKFSNRDHDRILYGKAGDK